jgi:pimeloyl-ACP methyl ester carboxylesterase
MLQSVLPLLADTVSLSVMQQGTGSGVLLLHAGAGPTSIRPLQRELRDCRTVLPIHPGFDGTPRPLWCRRVTDLTLIYLALIQDLGLTDVTVIGNSMGGWIAAELAASGAPAVSRLVILDGVGLVPTTETGPIINPLEVPPDELPGLVYAAPLRFARPPTAEGRRAAEANAAALEVYAGDPFFCDPVLPERLSAVRIPTLVLWGEADRIVTPAYGRALAGTIPEARFELVAEAGHFPQIEQTDRVIATIREFISRYRRS